jgi:hypothetical protein
MCSQLSREAGADIINKSYEEVRPLLGALKVCCVWDTVGHDAHGFDH